jgi:hypothetical protein
VAERHRRARLAARGSPADQIDGAVRDARERRLAVRREFASDGAAVETAAAVARWILDDVDGARG